MNKNESKGSGSEVEFVEGVQKRGLLFGVIDSELMLLFLNLYLIYNKAW